MGGRSDGGAGGEPPGIKRLNDRSVDSEEPHADRWSRLLGKLLQAFNSRLGAREPWSVCYVVVVVVGGVVVVVRNAELLPNVLNMEV